MKLRDEFGSLYHDDNFRHLFPTRGQPGLPPWRLALVTVLQYLEHLSDRQAANAVRGRIDWKYALGLELDDPGFHFSVLSEFRLRLIVGNAEALLLDTMLAHFQERGLVKSRGKQRTDSTEDAPLAVPANFQLSAYFSPPVPGGQIRLVSGHRVRCADEPDCSPPSRLTG